MNLIYISGSPREKSNTDFLLKKSLEITGGKFLKLSDYDIEPCDSCWVCKNQGGCRIEDCPQASGASGIF